jgi:hypothetical protein
MTPQLWLVLCLSQLPQSTLGAPPQSTLEGERPSVASAPAPRAATPSGLSVFTTSKGVVLERRVDASGNVQIDFPGGDPKDFSSPTVYERAKERLKAASALAPATPMAPVAVPASVAPVAPASSLGGPAPVTAVQPPAYAPPAYAPPAPAPLPTWQALAASPGYEAFGSVGPDGTWYYDPASVRPVGGGWVAQAQPAPVNYSAPVVSYAPPAVSYAAPSYYAAPASSACGPYGCSVSGGPVGGFYGGFGRGGVLGFGVFGRR